MGTTPSLSRRLRGAFAPTVAKLDERQLDGRRARHADQIRQSLAEGGDQDVGDLLQQANESYLEQDRRAQRAETRAATLLTASSMLMGLVATVGSLRLRAIAPQTPLLYHVLLGASLILVVIPFMLAARYALDVTTVQHGWSRPSSWRLVASRAGLDQQEFQVQTLAALAAAAEYNTSIGDWRFERLNIARRMFQLGLVLVVLHPLIRVATDALGVGLG